MIVIYPPKIINLQLSLVLEMLMTRLAEQQIQDLFNLLQTHQTIDRAIMDTIK